MMNNPTGKLCITIIMVLSAFAFLTTLSSISSIETDPATGSLLHMDKSFIPEAKNKSHAEGAAFAFLALGAQANQMNCPAAVESLVRFSGWDGDVYLITDQDYCFDTQEIVANAGMKADKFHYVVLAENFNMGGFDFEHPSTIGFRKARVRSLNMKTQLFNVISDPRIHTIAYVDCDILFTEQGCAQEFVTTGPNWNDFPIRFSHVYRDKDGNLEDIHAGSFVVHREHSQSLLQLWRKQIELGTDDGDNDAYMRLYKAFDTPEPAAKVTSPKLRKLEVLPAATTVAETATSATPVHVDSNTIAIESVHKKTKRNPLEPAEITKGVSADPMDQRNWFEKFLELENHRHFCMQHIPKARCARYGRKRVQEYVDRFQLRSYAGGYMYCTSSFIRPFLYGWFPMGYLPFCPKFEKML